MMSVMSRLSNFGVGLPTAAIAIAAAVVIAGPVGVQSEATGATIRLKSKCPQPSKLSYPHHLHRAVPAAKHAYGTRSRLVQLKRGKKSVYAGSARHECGGRVVRKSVYVELHPRGTGPCSACNFHGFVVHHRGARWQVWINY